RGQRRAQVLQQERQRRRSIKGRQVIGAGGQIGDAGLEGNRQGAGRNGIGVLHQRQQLPGALLRGGQFQDPNRRARVLLCRFGRGDGLIGGRQNGRVINIRGGVFLRLLVFLRGGPQRFKLRDDVVELGAVLRRVAVRVERLKLAVQVNQGGFKLVRAGL